MILDTHQHLWELDRLPYSWCASNAILNRSFTLSDYREQTAGLGIEHTVFVEADVDEPAILDEARHILSLAADTKNSIVGIVASVRPESEVFDDQIRFLASQRHVKGVRRLLHEQPDELSTRPMFRKNVRKLADHNLSFDICVLSRQLPLAIELVREIPEVQFVLDHCGNPPIASKETSDWKRSIGEMAALPNIVCKISGVVTQADRQNWTIDDIRPIIEYAIGSFGWDRVMFGSDWPVCLQASSLARWVETLLQIIDGEPEANRRMLLSENARRIYKC